MSQKRQQTFIYGPTDKPVTKGTIFTPTLDDDWEVESDWGVASFANNIDYGVRVAFARDGAAMDDVLSTITNYVDRVYTPHVQLPADSLASDWRLIVQHYSMYSICM
jgi:hypothetical protein